MPPLRTWLGGLSLITWGIWRAWYEFIERRNQKKERGNAYKGIVRDSSAPPVGEDTVGGQSCKSEDGQGIS